VARLDRLVPVGAATAESRQATAQVALAGVTVRQVMSVPVVTVAASISVEVFLSGTLLTYRHSAFPVTDDAGDPAGPVTLNRLRQIPAAERARTTLDLGRIGQMASLFVLSNGHIGLRINLDEGEPNANPGTYLGSFYEQRPLPYPEPGYGYPEAGQIIVNVTSGKLIFPAGR
jgi:CBS domain-containing protein